QTVCRHVLGPERVNRPAVHERVYGGKVEQILVTRRVFVAQSDRVLVGIVASPDVFPDLDKQRVDASERRCRNDFVDVIRGQLLAIAAKIEKTLQLSALGLQKPR